MLERLDEYGSSVSDIDSSRDFSGSVHGSGDPSQKGFVNQFPLPLKRRLAIRGLVMHRGAE